MSKQFGDGRQRREGRASEEGSRGREERRRRGKNVGAIKECEVGYNGVDRRKEARATPWFAAFVLTPHRPMTPRMTTTPSSLPLHPLTISRSCSHSGQEEFAIAVDADASGVDSHSPGQS